MPDYKQSKIYCVKSPTINKIYVGSTTKRLLCMRWGCHKYDYRKWLETKNNRHYISVFEVMKNNDAFIELIKEYPCSSKEELEQEETKCVLECKNAVNQQRPRRTSKQWREDNKEIIKKKKKEYYYKNHERWLKYHIEYGKKNKERKKEYDSKRVLCVACNKLYNRSSLNKHYKTQTHKKNLS